MNTDTNPTDDDTNGFDDTATETALDTGLVRTDEIPVLPPPVVGGSAVTHSANVAEPTASFTERHLGAIVGAFAVALFAAFALIAVLFAQLTSARGDLDATNEELNRVEAGAALFSSQVTGFQEQITELSPTIQDGLDEAIVGLQEFSKSTLEFTVNIDESVDISTDVVIDRTVEVPIRTNLPIDEEIDTTIIIDGPFGTEISLDITVPVNLDVPIDLTVDIPLNETVPIDAKVPVQIDVPIGVNVADTELATLASSLAVALESFTDVLDGLGG